VASPTFTLNRIYRGGGALTIHHYDFYRLETPGILANELKESLADRRVVTVIEWSAIVADILPVQRLVISFTVCDKPQQRQLAISLPRSWDYLLHGVEQC